MANDLRWMRMGIFEKLMRIFLNNKMVLRGIREIFTGQKIERS